MHRALTNICRVDGAEMMMRGQVVAAPICAPKNPEKRYEKATASG
jgi:hypothetical protein